MKTLLVLAVLLASPAWGQGPNVTSVPQTMNIQPPQAPSSDRPQALTTDHLLSIVNERDRLYREKFDALERQALSALSASDKSVAAALASSDKSAASFAAQTTAHFTSINSLQAKLDKQAEGLATTRDIRAVEERLTRFEARAEGAAWLWGGIGALILLAIAVGSAIFSLQRRKLPLPS